MQTRSLRLMVAFSCLLCVIGISYALTQVQFNNTSTIIAGQNIFITQPATVAPTCPADGNAAYIDSPASVAWTLTAGAAAQNYFFCIDNQGSAADAVSITSSLATGSCPASGGTLVYAGATGAPASLSPHAATTTPVDIAVCAGGSMNAGAGPGFTVTVT